MTLQTTPQKILEAIEELNTNIGGGSGSGSGSAEPSLQSSIAMTVGQDYTPGRMIKIIATQAGNVKIVFNDNTEDTFLISVGMSLLPLAVKRVSATGTTAVATYSNLY